MEAFPQRVFVNEIDARERKLKDGDKVKVYNERGALVLPCRLTKKNHAGGNCYSARFLVGTRIKTEWMWAVL